MKELNKLQTAIFLFGGILMAVGAGTTLLGWGSAPYIFAIGALGFSSMQMQQRYEGQNVTIRRLRRMMLLSDVLFLVAALLMFASKGNFLGLSYITYIEYVYKFMFHYEIFNFTLLIIVFNKFILFGLISFSLAVTMEIIVIFFSSIY